MIEYLFGSFLRGIAAMVLLIMADRFTGAMPLRVKKVFLLGFLLMVVMPFSVLPRQGIALPQPVQLAAVAAANPESVPAAVPAVAASVPMSPRPALLPPVPAERISWLEMMLWIYAAVAALLLVWRGGVWLAFRRRLRRFPEVDDPRILRMLEKAEAASGCRRKILVRNAGIFLNSPGCAGVWRPCILIPEKLLRDCDDAKLELLLLHECVHLKHHDPLWQAVQYFLSCFFWFNPGVRFLANRLNLVSELLCDEIVVRLSQARTAYARLIGEIAIGDGKPASYPIPGLNNGAKEIKHRIRELAMNRNVVKSLRSMPILVLLAAAAMLVAIPLFTFAEDVLVPYDPRQNVTENDIGWHRFKLKIEEKTQAKQYAEALGMFVWYYENILNYFPGAQSGVRNSYCLENWVNLGNVYPPALDKLRQIKADKVKLFRGNRARPEYPFVNPDGTPRDWQKNPAQTHEEWTLFFKQTAGDSWQFADIGSINEALGVDPKETVALFNEIEKLNPAMAKGVWFFIEDDVFKQKDYDRILQYMPDIAWYWEQAENCFHAECKLNARPEFAEKKREKLQQFSRQRLSYQADKVITLAEYRKSPADLKLAETIRRELPELLKR